MISRPCSPWRLDLPPRTGKHQPAPRTLEYVVGLDLGQANDPSAVAVIERDEHGNGEWEPGTGGLMWERVRTLYGVRHLERLPLGLNYLDQAAHVLRLMSSPPLIGAPLVIDRTGVGRAVCDLIDRAGLKNTIRVTITAGDKETEEGREHHVPKVHLIGRLQALLHADELKISAALPEAATLVRELQDFRMAYTLTGQATFNARSGKHDDLLLATACAGWWASRPVYRGPRMFNPLSGRAIA
jgi:hypothetical protein